MPRFLQRHKCLRLALLNRKSIRSKGQILCIKSVFEENEEKGQKEWYSAVPYAFKVILFLINY